MIKETNPFIVTGKIAPQYFCDRVQESARLVKSRYRLASSSSVQAATRKLLDRDFITETDKVYSVTDKLFAMWINKIYGDNFQLH